MWLPQKAEVRALSLLSLSFNTHTHTHTHTWKRNDYMFKSYSFCFIFNFSQATKEHWRWHHTMFGYSIGRLDFLILSLIQFLIFGCFRYCSCIFCIWLYVIGVTLAKLLCCLFGILQLQFLIRSKLSCFREFVHFLFLPLSDSTASCMKRVAI